MTLAEIPTAYAIHDEEIAGYDEETGGDEEVSIDVIKCYSISITLRCLIYVDFIFSCLFAFGNIFFSVFLFFPICGYLGVKKWNYNLIIYYFIAISVVNVLRLDMFLHFYFNSTEDTQNLYALNFIFCIICTFIEIWCARISYRYSKFLLRLSDDELLYLRHHGNIPRYQMILW